MRFDNIASAANTPGGFQAGVNDIIQAVMGAKRQQAEQAFQQSQMDQQQANSDRSFGAEQAQRLASNGYRDRELKANEMRAQTDQAHSRAQDLNMTMDNLGGALKYGLDTVFKPKTGGLTEYQKTQIEHQKAEDTAKADAELRSRARDLAGFSKEGLVHKKTQVARMGPPDIKGAQRQMIVDGKPLWEEKVIDDMPTDRHWADLESQYQKLKDPAAWQAKEDAKNSQFRGEVMPQAPAPRAAGGTPGLGAQVAQSLVTQNTGDTNGLSQNEPLDPAKAELDYAEDDRILQAKDPAYRTNRANPKFPYRKAIDANRAAGNIPKR